MQQGHFHLDDLDSNAQIRYAYNRLYLQVAEPEASRLVTGAEKELAELIKHRTAHNGGRESMASKRKQMRKLYFKGVRRSIFNKMMKEIGL